ncbi:DEAD-box ATP-dependent RNA helicase FANCM-like isoform X2 [Selaginella moellendorffii]|uniref:DEAD-box ATP-dependent RNA helicase FANCM-like isoform X2 n=1 Tax=Selaginella moellendorffii TaxID=88036 RepID=UPI000D1CB57A|nr:DEAD-box ATP-dependent RNA helicase FANCM-like isoform X2 [Selaginella moellendorffii]|eukprot:XP_024524582.1 DEAD-box ATP-dependent RNA helicase FANCM-like isoform X2 [Selaginella moellendorffii]
MPLPGNAAGFDDDGIDWAAAVTEVENVEAGYLQSKQNVEAQHRAGRQQTLDSFFRGRANSGEQNQARDGDVEGIQVPIDPVAATTWVYPENVPCREYQFSIAKTALFTNTLVSLPTGLGKTLIAAVVMYNFYRWFPEGKVVFTAPSKPLVVQQIEACHNVVGIPQALTIDMTGQINPSQRAAFWKSKRVFFVTPQVLEKDIKSGSCPLQQLVCLVVDEAHRALGNYAYCVAVREIMAAKIVLRILALTATPGSKHATIQSVVDNLNISCLEYRDEYDHDVSQYTHDRKLEVITVPLNAESKKLRDMLSDILQPVVLKLCNYGVFYNRDIARLTPYEFLTAREKFRQVPPVSLAQGQTGELEGCFGVGITLCHILKLLSSHGIKPAFEMLQQKLQQGLLARMMGRNEKLLHVKQLMQQTINHGAPSPKLDKMEEIILAHFGADNSGNTRAIIFTNFRESVKDIMECLGKINGPVKAMEFVGQSSGKTSKGQSQKIQQQVLQFRAGGYNTIVATCIGEEGLDIMEVDLVICFDANISPLRMIQRMGRTGRKRDGRVVVLASEGTEIQGYLNKQAKGKAIGKHMMNGGLRSFNFHASSRMVPHAFTPQVQMTKLTIEKFVPRFRKAKQDKTQTTFNPIAELTADESAMLSKYFKSPEEEIWSPSLIAFPNNQLIATAIHSVKHSSRTTSMLIDVLQELRELRELPPRNAIDTLPPSNAVDNSHRELPLSKSDKVAKNDEDAVFDHAGDQGWQDYPFHPDPYESLVDASAENAPAETLHPAPEQSSPPNHQFYFTNGAISITNEGYVMVSSPPDLFGRAPDSKQLESTHNASPVPISESPKLVEFVPETPDIAKAEVIFESPIFTRLPSEARVQRSGGNSSNEDWKCPSSELPSAVRKPRPLKRLKRGRELLPLLATFKDENRATDTEKEQIKEAVRHFIDDEAEVSSDAEVSPDTDHENCTCSDSFIDDNVHTSGPGSGAPVDMMAIYRRSLLSQSPAEALAYMRSLHSGSTPTSSSLCKSSQKSSHQPSVPASDSGKKSVTFNLLPPRPELHTRNEQEEVECSTKEFRKRKLSFHTGAGPSNNAIDAAVKTDVEVSNGISCRTGMENRDPWKASTGAGPSHEPIADDFFDDLDLDALEAEATKQSRLRGTQAGIEQQMDEDFECIPSFDLGI